MFGRSFVSSLLSADEADLWRFVFMALMSDDLDDLDEAIERANDDGSLPDEILYGLEGLYSFREFYQERRAGYTPEQREMIEAYDEDWTMDIVNQMNKHQFGSSEMPEPVPAPE